MPIAWPREKLKGPTKTQGDFNLAHKFSVEIDGSIVGGITKVEGLKDEHEVVEYGNGEDINTLYRPGRRKHGRLTLTRDFSATKEFFLWRKSVVDGKVERKSMSVILLNDAGEESMRYNFTEAWPVSYTGPSLDSRNSSHAQESIEVAYETVTMA